MSSKKHIMLSYQWDHQKLVKEVYNRLQAIGIPLWMDIQGGMKSHISESMAEGVENAAAICCFLTPKYQDSVACKDELTYAKEQRTCIIPILVTPDWKPTGWLGISIAGHKWIDFRDSETNMNYRIEQLVNEIKLLLGQKLDCFPDAITSNSSSQSTKEKETEDECFELPNPEVREFDPNLYYRLTTQWQGPQKSLDVVNDGQNNNRLILARTGNYTGQHWKITEVNDGFYRLTTQWQGPQKSLTVIKGDSHRNDLMLTDTGDHREQYWQITPLTDGFCRLTTQSKGPGRSLDIVNDGKNNNKLTLADTGDYSGQYWKITRT